MKHPDGNGEAQRDGPARPWSPVRRGLGRLLVAVAFLGLLLSTPSAQGVTHVKIQGALEPGTQSLLRRALDGAAERGDDLVVELDTPGGEVRLMWRLAVALRDAPERGVDTVAWIHDEALSAGALLALACKRVYMRPLGTLGSAQPVRIGPTGIQSASPDEALLEKESSSIRGAFRGIAEDLGRPPLLAEAMVDPDLEVIEVERDGERLLVSNQELGDMRERSEEFRFLRTVVGAGELLNVTGREAIEFGLADGTAESFGAVLGKIGQPGAVVTEVLPTRSEELAGWLYTLMPLFLLLGIVCAYIELNVPGFGLPGAASIAFFALALFGRYLVGLADIPQVVLMGAGFVLIAVELFVLPGTIWLGLLGAVALLVGLLWSLVGSTGDFGYALEGELLLEELFRMAVLFLIAVMLLWGLTTFLPKTPGLNRLLLVPPKSEPSAGERERQERRAAVARVGALGRTLTPLRPVGKVVLVEDETLEFEARAEGPILEAQETVRVVEVLSTGHLVVDRAEGST